MFEEYKICKRCIMDTTDPYIEFDENGVCNHCRRYAELAQKRHGSEEYTEERLQQIASEIKKKGKGKDYDCVIGLSGGVDSSYAAYQAKKLNIRPLAVHFDNGWNSEIAVKNIEKIVKKLDLDFYTYVIDWEEFRDLQLAFLKASVVDIEMITDHAIMAVMFEMAKKMKIEYILVGNNWATETIMPKAWVYHKWDFKNIQGIHELYGTKKLKNFPVLGLVDMIIYRFLKGVGFLEILNYLEYDKKRAADILARELDWRSYGSKHSESRFTKFYQAYLLPRKYNIDKRKAHLSTLICSNQITREEAMAEMKKPLYPPDELLEAKTYVFKKLGLTENQFEEIMRLPIKSHSDYPNGITLFKSLRKIKDLLNRTVLIKRPLNLGI